MSCPDKFKSMGQFHLYYNKEHEVPYMTIFIGGNHEASNVLEENYYGGFIMPKIFYLGKSGLIKFKGISIAGISGIFKSNDYFKGIFENDLIKSIKSVYHTREFEIAKLSRV
jgi:lariat debranching enzyme